MHLDLIYISLYYRWPSVPLPVLTSRTHQNYKHCCMPAIPLSPVFVFIWNNAFLTSFWENITWLALKLHRPDIFMHVKSRPDPHYNLPRLSWHNTADYASTNQSCSGYHQQQSFKAVGTKPNTAKIVKCVSSPTMACTNTSNLR